MVKIPPSQAGRFVDLAKDGRKVDGDLPKVFGSGGLKRFDDPPDVRPDQSKLCGVELYGPGEVK